MNKAEQVDAVYYEAAWDNNTHSEGCYALAVHTALELGGIEIYNSNDDHNNSSWSFAPTRTFKFDDKSIAHVTYSGVFV